MQPAPGDDALVDTLREAIIAGAYLPGARLNEAAVSAELGVSRNTLREAFGVLTEQGLLTRIPHRGVSVGSPSTAAVIDLYRMRRLIECGVLAVADPLHPAVAGMRAAIAAGEAAIEGSNWSAVGTANMDYHTALVSLADSPRLARTYRNTAAELRLAFMKIDNPEQLHRPFVVRNAEIVERLAANEPSEAARLLERYLIDSERTVLAAYTRLGIG